MKRVASVVFALAAGFLAGRAVRPMPAAAEQCAYSWELLSLSLSSVTPLDGPGNGDPVGFWGHEATLVAGTLRALGSDEVVLELGPAP